MIVERHAKVSLIRMDWTAIDKSLKPNNYVFKFQETKQAFLSLLEKGKFYRPMELRTRLYIEKGLRES